METKPIPHAPPAEGQQAGEERYALPLTLLAVAAVTLDSVVAHGCDQISVPIGDAGALANQAATRLELLQRAGLWAALRMGDATGAPYPPLVPLVGGWAGGWGGLRALMSSLAVWEGIGAAAAAWAGRRILGPWGGVIGAVVWLWLARSADPTPDFYTETAVGALSLATIVALAATEWLRHPGAAALAGLAAGLAMLAKFTAVLYVAPAIAMYVAIASIRALVKDRGRWVGGGAALVLVGSAALAGAGVAAWAQTGAGTWWAATIAGAALMAVAGAHSRRVLGVGSLVVAVGTVLSLLWYLPNHAILMEFLKGNLHNPSNSERLGFALALPFYACALFRGLLDTPAVILAAVGLGLSARRREGLPWLAAAVALVGMVLLASMPFANHRYIRPSALLFVPMVVAAIPRSASRPAAGVALALLTLLLASRVPALRAPGNRLLPAGARQSGSWNAEEIPAGTSRVMVDRYLASPWRGPKVMLALPELNLTPSPLVRAAADLDAACPDGYRISMRNITKNVDFALSILLTWNHHRRSIPRPGPGMDVCLATLTPGNGGPWTVQVELRPRH